MKIKGHYAKPGADDSFLNPEIDSKWAPRKIAVCSKDDTLFMSYILREEGSEYPIFTIKDHESDGELIPLTSDYQYYSNPAFIDHASRKKPMVAFFASNGGKMAAKIYELNHENNAECLDSLNSCCDSIYNVDASVCANGDIYLIYNGIVNGESGASLYLLKQQNGVWRNEEKLGWDEYSLNRSRVTVNKAGQIIAVADAYVNKRYIICWRDLSLVDGQWRELYSDDDWNMFPSIICASDGALWVSWLKVSGARFADVAGINHSAMMASFSDNKWQTNAVETPINLGLLPVRRYFGYDGLRRYPRLVALRDDKILLVWEQQKNETEVWENLTNGLLLGKVINSQEPSPVLQLLESGCCFAFDDKKIYYDGKFKVAAKSVHRKSGNDFIAVAVDLGIAEDYKLPEEIDWKHWTYSDFKDETERNRNIKTTLADGTPLKLYWGDLHCHSVHSPDAEGEIDELYHFSRDIAQLDFVAITDNDFYPAKPLLDSEIKFIAENALAFSDENFVAMSGYEWTFHKNDANHSFNHRIVIYSRHENVTVRRNESLGYTEKDFSRYIKDHGYFTFPHHGYWDMIADEPAVEITSGWGNYILDADTVAKNLNAGKRFSFLGNSDSHRFMPGLSGALTGVFAEELNQESIIESIRLGRCFATTGNRTAVIFLINDCFMGGQVTLDQAPLIKWHITAHQELESVTIIKDGQTVFIADSINGEWIDPAPMRGLHWYMLEVKEKGEHLHYPHNVASAWGKYLWSSPITVEQH